MFATTTDGQGGTSVRRNLVRHFLAMVLAMLVGMAVLGAVVRLFAAAIGQSDFLAVMPASAPR